MAKLSVFVLGIAILCVIPSGHSQLTGFLSNAISSTVGSTLGAGTSLITSGLSGTTSLISSGLNTGTALLGSTVGNVVGGVTSGLTSGLTSVIDTGLNLGSSVVSGLGTTLVSGLSGWTSFGANLLTGGLGFLTDGLYTALTSGLSGLTNGLYTAMTSGFQIFGNVMTSGLQGLVFAGQWISDGISSVITTISGMLFGIVKNVTASTFEGLATAAIGGVIFALSTTLRTLLYLVYTSLKEAIIAIAIRLYIDLSDLAIFIYEAVSAGVTFIVTQIGRFFSWLRSFLP